MRKNSFHHWIRSCLNETSEGVQLQDFGRVKMWIRIPVNNQVMGRDSSGSCRYLLLMAAC